MELFLGAAAVVLIVIALLYFRKFYLFSKDGRNGNGSEKGFLSSGKNRKGGKKTGSASDSDFVSAAAKCPLCQSPLFPGENLVSKVFTGSGNQEKFGDSDGRICYVYGCPSCYPEAKPGIRRSCPVCKKDVRPDGFLVSRMFTKTKSGKPHVIINGCGNCNRAERKNTDFASV